MALAVYVYYPQSVKKLTTMQQSPFHSLGYTPIFYSTLLLLILYAAPSVAEEIQSLESITAAVQVFLGGVRSDGGEPPPITVGSLDSRLRLSACSTPLEVSLAPGARSTGRTVTVVRCSSPRPWSLYVPAKVVTLVPVIVAARPLLRDQLVTAADIIVEQRDAGDLPGGYLTDPSQILGKVLNRPATTGAVLTHIQTQGVRIIHRGDRVTLVVQASGLIVRSAGVALADAGVGERVSVRNESSQRVVEGTVKTSGIVTMDLQ